MPAHRLAVSVPQDLTALCFHHRTASGPTIRLLTVGDVGLSGEVRRRAQCIGYSEVFRDLHPLLQSGNVVFGNLESPLLKNATSASQFAGETIGAYALSEAGFTVLHLANNHIYDYGPEGLQSTLDACRQAQLTPLGAGEDQMDARRIVRTDVGGLRVGWLGCGRTLKPQDHRGPFYWEFDETELLTSVQEARPTVDVLAVSIHIGFMYLDFPHPDHRALAEDLLHEGADLVLMHHAHVLQGVSIVGKGIVCYSLGNFLFDTREGNVQAEVMLKEQKEGAVLLFEMDKVGLCLGAALPTYMGEDHCVHWAVGDRGLEILTRLRQVSEALDGDYEGLFFRQRAERNVGLALEVVRYHLLRGHWSVVWQYLKPFRLGHVVLLAHWLLGLLRRHRKCATSRLQ